MPAQAAILPGLKREKELEIFLCQLLSDIFIAADNQLGKLFLLLLQRQNLLLDGAARDELVIEDVLGLPDTVSTIGGLILHRRVPPWIVMDDVIGAGKVQ